MTDLQHSPGPLAVDAGVAPPGGRVTVASVPSGHVYVRHLGPLSGRGPRRLPDPDPSTPDRPAGAQWWPPVMLDPAWAAAADFDVFHLHFGFDACSPEQLGDLTRTLRERGKPFVFTVHELRNPHHEERALHDAQLDALVPAADAVLTLTEGAAREIERRWGVRARVLPHPHVVDLPTMTAIQRSRAARPRREHFRVGLHLKSLRASMAPEVVLPTLVETVASLDDAVLQVNGHRDVLEPGGARFHAGLHAFLTTAQERGLVELRVHDYFTDDELWAYMASLDLAVLPYRFGTHSGWLEACRDLGTTVLAPTCGHFADQGPVLTYRHDEEGFDASTLHESLVRAYEERPHLGVSVEERRVQRRAVAAAHDEVYRGLLR